MTTLLVVGSNPPSQTSGQRTLARVELARVVLGFDEVHLTNLFAYPSFRSGGVTALGAEPSGWSTARTVLVAALDSADAVLLAYGVGSPGGRAKAYFRHQVAWLNEEIGRRELPSWWVGGAPRHPSRWQRHTFRHWPNTPFAEALALSLERTHSSAGKM